MAVKHFINKINRRLKKDKAMPSLEAIKLVEKEMNKPENVTINAEKSFWLP